MTTQRDDPDSVVAAIQAAETPEEAIAIERRHVQDTPEEDPGEVEEGGKGR
jgi:hypothetical protein